MNETRIILGMRAGKVARIIKELGITAEQFEAELTRLAEAMRIATPSVEEMARAFVRLEEMAERFEVPIVALLRKPKLKHARPVQTYGTPRGPIKQIRLHQIQRR